jgi:hypothetical protein
MQISLLLNRNAANEIFLQTLHKATIPLHAKYLNEQILFAIRSAWSGVR